MPDANDNKTPQSPTGPTAPAADQAKTADSAAENTAPEKTAAEPAAVPTPSAAAAPTVAIPAQQAAAETARAEAPTVAIPVQQAAPTSQAATSPADEAVTEAIPAAAKATDPKKMSVRPVQVRKPEPHVAAPAVPPATAPAETPAPPAPRPPAPRPPAPRPPAPAAATPPPPAAPAPEQSDRKPPPPPVAKPQRVAPAQVPKRKRGKWFAAAFAALLLIAAIVAVAVVATGTNEDANTPEAQIRQSIASYSKALGDGDIQTLRRTSCGASAEYYNGLTDEQFADVYKSAVETAAIPVVQSVDAVQITDRTAIASVTAYTKADPSNRVSRTLNLEESDDGWKVCDPPA